MPKTPKSNKAQPATPKAATAKADAPAIAKASASRPARLPAPAVPEQEVTRQAVAAADDSMTGGPSSASAVGPSPRAQVRHRTWAWRGARALADRYECVVDMRC